MPFFDWVLEIKTLQNNLLNLIKIAKLSSDDLFGELYQQLISLVTRSALGEFYTPPSLAKLMVVDSYKLGSQVLDPACGSGTFLIEIIRKIIDEKLPKEQERAAISKVFGFDVNPIAVMVAKVNWMLLLQNTANNDILPNIFHTNTIFPMKTKRSTSLALGEKYDLNFPEIGLSNALNESFFREEHFYDVINIFRAIDKQVTDSESVNEFKLNLNNLFSIKQYNWLKNPIGYMEETCKTNIIDFAVNLYESKEKSTKTIFTNFLSNSICSALFKHSFDLVIGNPPWLVLNGISSEEYKSQIKELAGYYQINPGAKNITNFEISALFVRVCTTQFLKKGGQLFFVLSNAFISGAQHDYTRQFKGLDNIVIWRFTKDLFRIHSICLSGFKEKRDERTIKVLVKNFECILNVEGKIKLFLDSQEYYKPYKIIKIKDRLLFKRFIPESAAIFLLPRGYNPYNEKCFQGAVVIPRTFFFVNILDNKEQLIKIEPNMQGQHKNPWNFAPFNTTQIEKNYIYKMAKSTELVPFLLLETWDIFLPVKKSDYSYDYNKLGKNAKQHFDMLNNIFRSKQKKGAAIKDLWTQINYQQKLNTPRQKAPLKVIYNQSGSIVKAAIIENKEIIIDSTLYLIPVNKKNEALYLCAVLNAPCITKDIEYRAATGAHGSVRHIHKLPMDLAIPPFNSNLKIHTDIVILAKKLIKKIKLIKQEFLQNMDKERKKKPISKAIEINNLSILKPKTIQNQIFRKLDEFFQELDKLVKALFLEK
jgi:SAM-dependent methyltransferase